ncbi:hypothetical protein K3495_g1268 [Podosphaera aphanis]|nr:hypothetical protein K3495_g1268 [Podosphaera aphanis]
MKDRYPLPLIKDTLDPISGANIYTKVDLLSALNRIRIAESHEWLKAFITRFGLDKQLVTPLGSSGAPATLQRYIHDVLYDVLDKYATAYLDNVTILSNIREDHVIDVREAPKQLRAAGLLNDIDKCDFHTIKTIYLGLIITPGGIEWESSTSKRQL